MSVTFTLVCLTVGECRQTKAPVEAIYMLEAKNILENGNTHPKTVQPTSNFHLEACFDKNVKYGVRRRPPNIFDPGRVTSVRTLYCGNQTESNAHEQGWVARHTLSFLNMRARQTEDINCSARGARKQCNTQEHDVEID